MHYPSSEVSRNGQDLISLMSILTWPARGSTGFPRLSVDLIPGNPNPLANKPCKTILQNQMSILGIRCHSQLQVLGWCSIMYKYVCTNDAWDSFGIRITPPISKYARRQHVHVKSCAAAAFFQPTPVLWDWFKKRDMWFASYIGSYRKPEILRLANGSHISKTLVYQ